MTSMIILLAWTTIAAVTAAAQKSEASKVPEQLRAFLDGKLPPEKLEITYFDARGLKGELKIVVHGTGKVEQHVVRREARPTRPLTAESVRKLVKLLIDQEAWTQKTPQAASLPDEARVTLKIVAGDAESTIWERVREMEKNERLTRISALLQKVAWRDAPPK